MRRLDDKAAAPTMAVILMVAIVVVLAVVVLMAVNDSGRDSLQPVVSNIQIAPGNAPTSGLDAGLFNLEHRGGDCLSIANTRFAIDRGGQLVTLTANHANVQFCAGETMALDEIHPLDFVAVDAGQRVELVIIDELSELIVDEQLVQLHT